MTNEGFNVDELATLLDAIPKDSWKVVRTLTEHDSEATQVVQRTDGVGDALFVRKLFKAGTGLGAAYEQLFAAQQAGARFAHLPLIYDMTRTEAGTAVVTEYVAGETLAEAVRRRGPGVAIACATARDICDALVELHEGLEKPIVHRDIKPTNIMVAGTRFVLVDLGIARAWRPNAAHDTVRLGTPGYAPPEQYGFSQTTTQSDIYAAGMVIAFCFTGEEPTPQLRESGFNDSRIPAAFRSVLAKACAIDPSARWGNARDMKAAFEQAADVYMATMRPAAAAPVPPVSGPAVNPGWHPAQQTSSKAPAQVVWPQPHAPAVAAPARQRAQKPARFWGVRNVALLLVWLLFFFICVSIIFFPSGAIAQQNFMVRLIAYASFIIVPSGLTLFALSDYRWALDRIPFLQRHSRIAVIAAALGASFLLVIIGYVLIMMAGYVNPQ